MNTAMNKYSTKVQKFRPYKTSQEIPLTIFAVLWFLVCTLLLSLTNAYLDRTNPFQHLPSDQRIRLPDPLLDALHPEFLRVKAPADLSDTLVHIAPIIMLARVALGGKNSFLILRRLGYLVGLGYLIRIPFVVMTILPNSNIHCEMDISSSLFQDTILIMMQIKKSCGDVVFSGHTIMFMSASLVWTNIPISSVTQKVHRIINLVLVSYSFVGVLSLIASTYHYTIDCVISVLTMLFLWLFYHYVANTNHLDGTLISKFIKYIDGDRYRKTLTLSTHNDLAQSVSV